MTKTEAIKELLKYNLDEIIYKFGWLSLSIAFDVENFFILDQRHNKVVLVDKILNYDLDFESQKRFILNVLRKFYKFVEDENSVDFEAVSIEDENICRIVGYRKYMYKNFWIEILKDKIKGINLDNYERFLSKLFNEIENNLNGFRVEVFYSNKMLDREGFHVNIRMLDDVITVNYLVDDYYLKYNTPRFFIEEKKIILYYSDVERDEAIKAVNYITKLLYFKSFSL